MTDVIFSFDTEDFTSSEAADAIVTEANILRDEGVSGCFSLVGLLAKQLVSWGRADVIEALSHHEVDCHSYGHTYHPMINEYTDIEDYKAAHDEVVRQETLALRYIREATGREKVFAACPPGNSKSYAAMYAYADMGIPVYCDTVCDTVDDRGVWYCNIYQMEYSVCVDGGDGLYMSGDEERLRAELDHMAGLRHAIVYTHPHYSLFSVHWDVLNYDKVNRYPFGQWVKAPRWPREKSDAFYASMRKFVRMIKADPRFRITTYEEIAARNAALPPRVIKRGDLPQLRAALRERLYSVTSPGSFCLTDMFLACRDMLLGKEEHACGKVYGFLSAPVPASSRFRVSAEDMRASAASLPAEGFLPEIIDVGGGKIGPADWLYAALDILCGEKEAEIIPGRPQLPSLDEIPQTRDLKLKGTWRHSDDFEDRYLSDRLRWQSWTMRF